ncbi:NTP transferase domain-containing protein [Pontibacter sp. SGAir0037]|uniref:nucleotidyltransferase family protein n=1 Tax=Pontibacter sp. SGAir0037 TaxID=2571030 RepID=UPI0010CCF3C5|nr:nucleotidyltransferase family protein [Pontibacter sp. SGAir0037]QCR24857.1 nucleotidyltransferase family protein [Pontibacter sp. SGAir0037]
MTGLVLLAAGASTRLGEPKQQLLYQGKTLLQHAVEVALQAGCAPVVVVLGARAASILPEVEKEPVSVVQNPGWEEGMASSIRSGLTYLLRIEPETTGCIFMVCDQPYVDAALLNRLVQASAGNTNRIVASAYKDTAGTPVLFGKSFFTELLALKGQEGARKILFRHQEAVTTVAFPLGAIDIDTAEDYKALLQSR